MKKINFYIKVPSQTKDFYTGRAGLVEVDREIAPIIKILCEKGYTTIASCAGHSISDTGYIWLRNLPPCILPDMIYRDEDCIRWPLNRLDRSKRKIYKSLLRWADSLPHLEKEGVAA